MSQKIMPSSPHPVIRLLPMLLVLILPVFLDKLHHCLGHNLDGGAFHGTSKSYYLDKRFLLNEHSPEKVVSVEDFGAKADGNDDSGAFQKAWKEACSSSTPTTVTVPKGKNYLLDPVTFNGPCNSDITVMIEGSIEAPANLANWEGKNPRRWITFSGVDNLVVQGGGTLNGNGKIWWQNSCKIKPSSSSCMDTGPTALTFYSCKNLRVENLQLRDSQRMHVSFEKCSNVQASGLSITAPEQSPNTDGIHVTNTQAILITNCVIQTGDDCISIESGSTNVVARSINCGPGHGISIGSLGDDGSEAQVSDVTVDTAKLVGTTNGVRIKTMNASSAVEVSNVVYKNVKGTSASEVAINLECSKSVPCRGILLQDVNLAGAAGASAKATCDNVVALSQTGTVTPLCAHN